MAPVVEYRRSSVMEALTLGGNEGGPADLNAHMEKWTAKGWQLVTVTTVARDGYRWEVLHNFFWQREKQT